VIRVALLALVAGFAAPAPAGCHGPPPAGTTPLGRSLLLLAADFHEASPDEETWAAEELGRIAARVRVVVGDRADDRVGDNAGHDRNAATVAALRDVVFGSLGFEREVNDTGLRFVLLPSVLRARRGSCVGLGTLYLVLGEMLSLPLEGVLRPGHFYVRTRDAAGAINVELLHRGEGVQGAWYEGRFPVPSPGAREYGRGLSLSEVRGVVEYDVGNERRRQGRISEARDAYARSARDFPDLAEAYASLGAMQQLLGHLDDAAHSYGLARRANPGLPGVAENLELLGRERAGDY
jgi:tetratricopeptide (TPR) repeat protein